MPEVLNYPVTMKKFDYLKYQRKNPVSRPVNGCFHPDKADAFVVIPVLAEDFDLLAETFSSLNKAAGSFNIAITAVVNAPADAPEEWKNANQILLGKLEAAAIPNVSWINASDFPIRDGVGEARKIGMDTVIQSLDFEHQRPIFSLDADTSVEENYFSATLEAWKKHPEWEGVVFNFQHRTGNAGEEIKSAITEYENYIRSYRDKLKSAGSPYGYASIGSAFAVNSVSYVRAGGMRKRSAGEDFYFLQALRKCGPIGELENVTVHPAARISRRTPFGTGRTLERTINGVSLRYYPELSFQLLKKVLELAGHLQNNATPKYSGQDFFNALPKEAKGFFAGFPERWEQMSAAGNRDDFAFHRFFDGLKTLQFIKYVSAQLELGKQSGVIIRPGGLSGNGKQ